METWKDIEGYEGYYQISNLGRVKSLGRLVRQVHKHGKPVEYYINERILKNTPDNKGYPSYKLVKNGISKPFRAHRLIAKYFIPNPNNYPVVNHKNGIKDDLRIENLEWCTMKQNINHAFESGLMNPVMGERVHQSKLTEKEVLEIRGSDMTSSGLANKYNVRAATINRIKNRSIWKHI